MMETIHQRFLVGEPMPEVHEYYETGAAAAALADADDEYYYYYDDGYPEDDDGEGGGGGYLYEGYLPTAVDPDWWFTVYIIVICLVIYFSLPLWILVGNCFGFHDPNSSRRALHPRNRDDVVTGTGSHDPNNNDDDPTTTTKHPLGGDILIKQLDEARSMISGGYSHSHVPTSGSGGNSLPSGSVVSGSIARSRAAGRNTTIGCKPYPPYSTGGYNSNSSSNNNNNNNNNTNTNQNTNPSSPGSVFSGTSGYTASVISGTSAFTNTVLHAKPKRSRHAGRRPGRTKCIVIPRSVGREEDHDHDTSHNTILSGKLDVRMAAEFTKAEMELRQQQRHEWNSHNSQTSGSAVARTLAREPDGSSVVDETRSEVTPSILSKLDPDAISVHDAVDAREGIAPSLLHHDRLEAAGEDRMKNGYGCRHPWLERLLEVVDVDTEMHKYIALATHYSVQGILGELLGLVEIALIGHLMGPKQANAYIVVGILCGFTGTITTGFYECAGLLIPQAHGARNYLMIGRYMQLGTIFYTVAAIPGAIFWCFYMKRGILWYGFDEETAVMGQKYLFVTLPTFFTYGFDAILWEVLNTLGHESYATWFTVVSGIFHTGIVVAMLFCGVKDLFILGIFEMLSEVFFFVLNLGIMIYMGWLDKYWDGLFKSNGLKDLRAVKNVICTAMPLSVAWILTYGEWEVMTFFARRMGNNGAEVAAWGLMGYLWGISEIFTDGFGDAAEVRIGFRMGAGQVRVAKLLSEKAMYFTFTIAVYATGVFFLLAMYLPGWLTPDPTLQRMLFDIIPLVGFANIWMVTGMVAYAVIGAQGRITTATFLEFFISWGIGVPLAAIMTMVFNYNLEGIVASMTITYTIGTNMYLYMLYTSDWEALSATVVARNAVEGQTYDGFDWTELPEHILEAAITLGYNQSMWESGEEEPESNEKMWDELIPAERKAAILLGYTKKTWNGEADTVEEKLPYDDYSFDSLPPEIKTTAEYLGYNKDTWDAGGKVSAHDKKWDALTFEERKAAEHLGYDSRKWAISHGHESNVMNDEWASLSDEARSAAKILGYTASIWNNDGSVPVEDKNWNELTTEECGAATALGYTEEKWNYDDE